MSRLGLVAEIGLLEPLRQIVLDGRRSLQRRSALAESIPMRTACPEFREIAGYGE